MMVFFFCKLILHIVHESELARQGTILRQRYLNYYITHFHLHYPEKNYDFPSKLEMLKKNNEDMMLYLVIIKFLFSMLWSIQKVGPMEYNFATK